MARVRARRSQTNAPLRFDQKLVLNQWMLSLLGRKSFKDLAEVFTSVDEDGLDEQNVHRFTYRLIGLPGIEALPRELLLHYDQNIVRHTFRVSEERREPLRWKYFQWLALLFTEIYLDRFFQDRDQLLNDLNDYVMSFNENRPARDQVPLYDEDDLRKIAFWNATGSGKTLLMHVNILQYLHYLDLYGDRSELNRIILLTPNDGLSRQHLEEFQASGLPAEQFAKDGGKLFAEQFIEIVDIHKLKEEAGEKTVAIDAFEGNNLVLVDEGHRGASTSEIGQWMQARDRLCEQGFSFEYSATFGQAMRSPGELHNRYAKCILFDYSYKYFYSDGFGKDYRILNLADDTDEERRALYLTACLLSFYQQLRLYHDNQREFRQFLIEKPLMVFVGNTVNAVRTQGGRQVSDVIDILLFFAEFVRERRRSIQILERLLRGRSGLLDRKGREIFATAFSYLVTTKMSAEEIYADILRILFNTSSSAAFHVVELKGADGEIALRLGDNDPFGLINVGDAAKLRKLCEDHSDVFVVSEQAFSGSLFSRLNNTESTINILIGSKRFTEGWNSWRVSTMGLMNVGRSAGAEIIQLFGRGVRLKGYGMSLKRSSRLNVTSPKFIHLLETLNVFGVRAQYMEEFRDYLAEEGVPDNEEPQTSYTLPTVNLLGDKKLASLRVKDGVDFKRQGPKPLIGDVPEEILQRPIELNWYPMIQARHSKEAVRMDDETALEEGKFTEVHLALIDLDSIWFALQDYKNEKNYYNLILPREAIPKLLSNPDWYVLKIPKVEMEVTSLRYVRRWQEIAIALLRSYIDRYYKLEKARFEKDYLEYHILGDCDRNFVREYHLMVRESENGIVVHLEALRHALESGTFVSDVEYGNFEAISFGQHLYQPLLAVKEGDLVQVSPVSLNKGERNFVVHLRTYFERNRSFFDTNPMYLLRNQSRGRGIGFFEAGNFYPDFIMWLLVDGKQYVTFIDPKGLRNIRGTHDPKIRFHDEIKEIETRLGDPDIILNSFVVSETPYHQIKWWNDGISREELEKANVFFQDDRGEYIKLLLRKVVG